MNEVSEFVWEFLETEDYYYRFFIQLQNQSRPSRKAAFIIIPKGQYLSPWKSHWVLIMNRVGILGMFKSKKECFETLKRLIEEKATVPMKVFVMKPFGYRLKLFAERKEVKSRE